MVGNVPQLTTPRKNVSGSAITVKGQILYVPLEFWFARNPGLKEYWTKKHPTWNNFQENLVDASSMFLKICCNITQLLETPNSYKYQSYFENHNWPREYLGYGNNFIDWTISSRAPTVFNKLWRRFND